jgi:ACS family tartrate transporter-like MFS transporter
VTADASLPALAADAALERATMARVTRRFGPVLFACFVVAFLDRVNIGFAALTMNADLGLSSTAFGLGAGLFFLTYFLLEVPSNLALERFGARAWIARIMLTWGLVSGTTAFVRGEWSFYLVRLLLGAAEAGFFPGVIYFLTLWFPVRYRARIVAIFLAAVPIASVVGSPISGLLMQLDGAAGLKGWQWMFLIEAIPALALTPIVLARLSDAPAGAAWLGADERDWLERRLRDEARAAAAPRHAQRALDLIRSPIILELGAAYFGLTGVNYGLSFFLPQIVRSFGLTILQTGFVAAVPFALATGGMMWWGRRSDVTGERRFHVLLPFGLAAGGLAASTLPAPPVVQLAWLSVAAFGVYAAFPVYWTVPPPLLDRANAAAGIALINSIGNLSGFASPYAVGAIKDATGGFSGGLRLIAAVGAVSWLILARLTRAAPPRGSGGD